MRWAAFLCVWVACASAFAQEGRTGVLRPESAQTVRARVVDTASFFPPVRGSAIDGWRGGFLAAGGGGGPFPGVGWNGASPANCDLAVGPGHIVQAVNSQIAFFSKGGTPVFQQSAADFFSGLAQTASPDQPRAVYDRAAGRFFVMFVETDHAAQASNVLLAVSDDDDPNGAWFQYRFDAVRVLGEERFWFGRPGLGYNPDGIAITGSSTEFTTGLPGGTRFMIIAKAELLTGAPATARSIQDMVVNYGTVGETAGSDRFIFGAGQRSANRIRVYGVSDPGQGGTLVMFVEPQTIASSPPPAMVPSTGGAMLETNGERVISCFWHGDRLLVAYNVLAGAGESGVRWSAHNTEMFVQMFAPVVWFGSVTSAGKNFFVPAVALNKHLDASLMFTSSSTSVTSDIAMVGRIATDPAMFMSSPFTLATATGSPYSDTKWGTYFGTAVDPTDDETFWGTAMVVRPDGLWDTQIVSWTVSKTHAVPPASHAWFRGFPFSGSTASLFEDDDDYLSATAGITLGQSEPPIQLDVTGAAPPGQVLSFGFEVVARVSTPGLVQRVLLWNWTTSQYDDAGTQVATTGESLQSVGAPGPLVNYVQPGTGLVRARVQWFRTGITLHFPWSAAVDRAGWRIRAR